MTGECRTSRRYSVAVSPPRMDPTMPRASCCRTPIRLSSTIRISDAARAIAGPAVADAGLRHARACARACRARQERMRLRRRGVPRAPRSGRRDGPMCRRRLREAVPLRCPVTQPRRVWTGVRRAHHDGVRENDRASPGSMRPAAVSVNPCARSALNRPRYRLVHDRSRTLHARTLVLGRFSVAITCVRAQASDWLQLNVAAVRRPAAHLSND
jgi:hypothetical protein